MRNWKKVILDVNNSMLDAIEVLNKEALRIVLIVDKDQKLIGTVTDGDIRRALISHKSMDTLLSEIMNRKPTSISSNASDEDVLMIMKEKDILQFPVIDSDGRVVGLKNIQNTISNKKHDNTVFLMAGGFGTRLKPLTDETPKPLLRIGKSPILEIIIEQLIASGFHNFVISTHYKAQMLKDYFGNGSKWNVNISYVYEHHPLGTAGALGLIKMSEKKLPILIMNGDLLTKIDFSSLLEYHKNQSGVATMCVREYDLTIPYGVVESTNQVLESIEEKPVHKFFVNAGIYILEQSLLIDLDGNTRIDMTTLLSNQVKNERKVNVFPLHEYWLDIGQIEHYEQANKESKTIFG